MEHKYDPSNDPITPQEESLFQAAEWLEQYIDENKINYFEYNQLIDECPEIEKRFPGFTDAVKNGTGLNDLNAMSENYWPRMQRLAGLVYMLQYARDLEEDRLRKPHPKTKWKNAMHSINERDSSVHEQERHRGVWMVDEDEMRYQEQQRQLERTRLKFANRQIQKEQEELRRLSKNKYTLMTKFEKVKPHQASEDVTKNILSFVDGLVHYNTPHSYAQKQEYQLFDILEPMIIDGLSFDQFQLDRSSVAYSMYQHIRSLLDSSQQNEFNRRIERFFRTTLQYLSEDLIQCAGHLATTGMSIHEFEAANGPVWESIDEQWLYGYTIGSIQTLIRRFQKVEKVRDTIRELFDKHQRLSFYELKTMIPSLVEERYTFSDLESGRIPNEITLRRAPVLYQKIRQNPQLDATRVILSLFRMHSSA